MRALQPHAGDTQTIHPLNTCLVATANRDLVADPRPPAEPREHQAAQRIHLTGIQARAKLLVEILDEHQTVGDDRAIAQHAQLVRRWCMFITNLAEQARNQVVQRDDAGRAAVFVQNDSRRLARRARSEEHTSELQSRPHIVCRLLLEKKKTWPAWHRALEQKLQPKW